MDDEEQFDSVECVDCEQWFDENYANTCGECEASVCPKCSTEHVCEPVTD